MALRQLLAGLRRQPGLSLIVVLTLALGIGANIAVFSVVDGILFQPLTYPAPERLVTAQNGYFPPGYFTGLQARQRAVTWAAYSGAADVTLVQNGQPEEIEASTVSANFFGVLGVAPALGQGFEAGENQPGRDGEAVLSDALWRTHFGERRDVLGSVVNIAGQPRRIVGVMPPGFRFPSTAAQAWLPVRIDPSDAQGYWSTYSLQLVGRLSAGATLGIARAELQGIVPEVTVTFPYPMTANWAALYPLIGLRQSLVGNLRLTFLLLLGAVGLVLLIACVNVANLLLGSVAGRQRELALRLALGAGRGRLLRELVGEALLLALGGGALGLGLAALAVPLLRQLLPTDTPQLAAVGLHWRALGFGLLVAVATGLVTGLLPGWRASGQHANLDRMLRSEGAGAGQSPSRQRLAAGLLIAEVAVALVVMVGATLLATSLIHLNRLDPGFNAGGVTTLRIAPSNAYCGNAGRCKEFYRQLQEQVRGLPGVEDAALVNALPLGGTAPIAPVIFQDHPLLPGAEVPLVWANLVTPGYLRTMRIRLLEGRGFTSADAAGGERVALINAALGRQLWPHEHAVGKQVITLENFQPTPWTIVGVVAEVREMQLAGDPQFFRGEVYFPYVQALATHPVQGSLAPMTLVLRSGAPPSGAQLRALVASLNPDIPAATEQTLASVVQANLTGPRATTWLFLLFALLALTLGAIGVYGVMAHNVTRRTREFGVRLALGASRGQVLTLVLRRSLLLALAGTGAGLIAAWLLARLMRGLLFQLSPSNPATYATAAAVVILVAMVASYLPARRATRVDPLVALRTD